MEDTLSAGGRTHGAPEPWVSGFVCDEAAHFVCPHVKSLNQKDAEWAGRIHLPRIGILLVITDSVDGVDIRS